MNDFEDLIVRGDVRYILKDMARTPEEYSDGFYALLRLPAAMTARERKLKQIELIQVNPKTGEISRIPSEQKRGRWWKYPFKAFSWRCDQCFTLADRRTQFCPTCGAKMDGGGDHGEKK